MNDIITDMEVIKQDLKLEYFDSNILNDYLGRRHFATFDIETMGLDPRRAPMILAGFMNVEPDGKAVITQYFLDRPEEEHALLDAVIGKLNSYDYVVTYNGKRFDLPYVMKRYSMMNHKEPEIRAFDLDLYLAVKGFSGLKGVLPSLSQKSVEEYMGLTDTRSDKISGGESVELYYQYMTEEDPIAKEHLKRIILLHNYDDVIQLYRLLPLLRQCDMHAAAYKLGFPVYQEDQVLTVGDIRLTGRSLTVKGSYTGDAFTYHGFSTMERPYETIFTKDREFKVVIPVMREADSVYVNLLDFFRCGPDDEGMDPVPQDLKDCAGFVNDFLVLKAGDDVNYRDINIFLKKLLEKI